MRARRMLSLPHPHQRSDFDPAQVRSSDWTTELLCCMIRYDLLYSHTYV